MFILQTEADAKRMAAMHATDKKELMFTTYSFTHKKKYNKDAVHPVRHIWENLRRLGRLNNSIILTYDVHTCEEIWGQGIPCFLDRYLPQPDELPGEYGTKTPHWYQKYAWALRFLDWGYRVTFFETDTCFLKDPFPYRNSTYDLEGLSDWRKENLPAAKTRYTNPCSVYHMEKGDHGDNFLEWGETNPDDIRHQHHVNPCMSTGFWFAEPTTPTMEFFRDFIDLMLHYRNWQTDQRLWNEVIMAYLIGQTDHEPLRFRLLDVSKFSNFEVVGWREEQKLATDSVVLHGGALAPWDKEPTMRDRGCWLGEQWNASTGAAEHINFLSGSFNRTLPPVTRPQPL